MSQMRCFGCMALRENGDVCEHCGFSGKPNEIHQLPLGSVLKERYLVGRVLGQGGFGITYICWDKAEQTAVAIKEFYPSGLVLRQTSSSLNITCYAGGASESFAANKARFAKEANSLLQMKDLPEIVQVIDFFEENGTAYIVMEYVEGITLKNYIKQLNRRLRPEEVTGLLQPLVAALGKVHALHLLHRDISPDNIMLPKAGGIKLIDFGTVRYMDDSNLSKSTEAILKPGFAPMEQYQNRGKLGPWTDVYALCATMYYCMTGKVLQDAPSRMVEEDTLSVAESIPGVPAEIEQALQLGLAVRIGDRIQNMNVLHTILYGKEIPGLPVPKKQEDEKPASKTEHTGKTTSGQNPAQPQKTAPKPKPQPELNPKTNSPQVSAGKKKSRSVRIVMTGLTLFLVAGVLAITLSKDSSQSSEGFWTKFTDLTSAATIADGWHEEENERYYYENGKPVTGWKYIDGNKYYFDEEGIAAIGRTMEIDGKKYAFNTKGKLVSITHPQVASRVADKRFYFESSQGDIREVTYRELNTPFRNGKSFRFSVRISDIEYGKAEGTWVLCLRVNGQWIRYDEFEVTGNSGSFLFTAQEPVTFDAFTAYRKTGGPFRASCAYEITDVIEMSVE